MNAVDISAGERSLKCACDLRKNKRVLNSVTVVLRELLRRDEDIFSKVRPLLRQGCSMTCHQRGILLWSNFAASK